MPNSCIKQLIYSSYITEHKYFPTLPFLCPVIPYACPHRISYIAKKLNLIYATQNFSIFLEILLILQLGLYNTKNKKNKKIK